MLFIKQLQCLMFLRCDLSFLLLFLLLLSVDICSFSVGFLSVHFIEHVYALLVLLKWLIYCLSQKREHNKLQRTGNKNWPVFEETRRLSDWTSKAALARKTSLRYSSPSSPLTFSTQYSPLSSLTPLLTSSRQPRSPPTDRNGTWVGTESSVITLMHISATWNVSLYEESILPAGWWAYPGEPGPSPLVRVLTGQPACLCTPDSCALPQ